VAGFGVLFGKEATRALKSIWVVSSPILVVILEGKPTTNLVITRQAIEGATSHAFIDMNTMNAS
jgi:hypothetical protein